MQDISGFGLQINIQASSTFPVGFPVTQFADDADPFDIPGIDVADSGMGVNGDLLVWNKAVPINVTISVVPHSIDDINLGILLEANRVGRGKTSARDEITMTGIYPDGIAIVLSKGFIVNGPPGTAIASAGRKKSKTYSFRFENKLEI